MRFYNKNKKKTKNKIVYIVIGRRMEDIGMDKNWIYYYIITNINLLLFIQI